MADDSAAIEAAMNKLWANARDWAGDGHMMFVGPSIYRLMERLRSGTDRWHDTLERTREAIEAPGFLHG